MATNYCGAGPLKLGGRKSARRLVGDSAQRVTGLPVVNRRGLLCHRERHVRGSIIRETFLLRRVVPPPRGPTRGLKRPLAVTKPTICRDVARIPVPARTDVSRIHPVISQNRFSVLGEPCLAAEDQELLDEALVEDTMPRHVPSRRDSNSTIHFDVRGGAEGPSPPPSGGDSSSHRGYRRFDSDASEGGTEVPQCARAGRLPKVMVDRPFRRQRVPEVEEGGRPTPFTTTIPAVRDGLQLDGSYIPPQVVPYPCDLHIPAFSDLQADMRREAARYQLDYEFYEFLVLKGLFTGRNLVRWAEIRSKSETWWSQNRPNAKPFHKLEQIAMGMVMLQTPTVVDALFTESLRSEHRWTIDGRLTSTQALDAFAKTGALPTRGVMARFLSRRRTIPVR